MLFSFKHMDRSEAIEQAAREAFEGVMTKFSQKPTSFQVIFSVNRKFQSVHLSAHLADGHQIELEQGEDDIYKAIDHTAEKLDRDLRKHKNKMLARRKEPKLAQA